MNIFSKMVNLQCVLFTLMLVGVLVKKLHIVDEKSRKALSDLLIDVILPCNIVNSFIGELELSEQFMKNCILAFFISLAILILASVLNRFVFIWAPEAHRKIMSYGMLCSNSSFIGIPITEAIYGAEGVMYISFFQIPIRIVMWTAGLLLFTDVDNRNALKKLVLHPCIIAVALGTLLMVLPVTLPAFVQSTVSSLSKCTSPISMIVIGTILADADIKSMFSKPVLFFTFIRLLAFPALIYAILLPFKLESMLMGMSVLMSGMPAGSSTSIIADKYDCDSMFASQIVAISFLCSAVTIPALSLFL